MIDVIKHKKIFLGISLFLIVASISSIFYFGFNLGIDFKSGSLWQVRIPNTEAEELKLFFETETSIELSAISFNASENIYALSFEEISEEKKQETLSLIKSRFVDAEDLDFWSISPSVSEELKRKSIMAVGFVLAAISFYIAFAFRKVSQPISSWKYGFITLITLLHDVLIPAGLFAYLGYLSGITVDTNFIVALLVVMGFSVHDTIVVFDRIRENLLKSWGKVSLGDTINKSINETIHRSINTSLTLIIVLIALYALGPVSLKLFILTISVGTIVGTYSSIFVASPILIFLKRGVKS